MKKGIFCNIKIKILPYNNDLNEMDEDYNRDKINKCEKYICSFCLNPKTIEKSHKKNTNCPICQNNCKFCIDRIKIEQIPLKRDSKDAEPKETQKTKTHEAIEKKDRVIKTKTKSVQTDQTENKKSLTLLNEVLTVFQSKKTERFIPKDVKDACVSTEKQKPKLSKSKTFQISLDHNTKCENGKYLITSSKTDSRSKIDLIKHKSSSIPQMKIEELKYSLKEKAKSKDVIEEVNRMFATVQKEHRTDSINRPSLRSGPRILPVVKNMVNEEILRTNTLYTCKCCNCSNCMSSGDSLKCHHRELEKSQCCRRDEIDRGGCKCCHYTKCRGKMMGCDGWHALKEFQWDKSDRNFSVDPE